MRAGGRATVAGAWGGEFEAPGGVVESGMPEALAQGTGNRTTRARAEPARPAHLSTPAPCSSMPGCACLRKRLTSPTAESMEGFAAEARGANGQLRLPNKDKGLAARHCPESTRVPSNWQLLFQHQMDMSKTEEGMEEDPRHLIIVVTVNVVAPKLVAANPSIIKRYEEARRRRRGTPGKGCKHRCTGNRSAAAAWCRAVGLCGPLRRRLPLANVSSCAPWCPGPLARSCSWSASSSRWVSPCGCTVTGFSGSGHRGRESGRPGTATAPQRG